MTEPAASNPIIYDCTPGERMQGSQILAGRRTRPLRSVNPNAKLNRAMAGWILFVALAIMLIVLLNNNSEQKSPNPRPGRHMPESSQLAIGVFALGAAVWIVDGVRASIWRRKQLPRWHGKLTYSFDETGLTQWRPGKTDIFAWKQFRRFYDGPNVFVLRRDRKEVLIVPKRLFASDDERERVRLLLQREIASSRPAN